MKIIKRQKKVAGLLKSYAGKWVTLSADKTKVLGVSGKIETALSLAHQKGESHPHLIKAPDALPAVYIF